MSEPVKFKIGYVMLPGGNVPETFATRHDDPNFERNVGRMLKRWTDCGIDAKAGWIETECEPGVQ